VEIKNTGALHKKHSTVLVLSLPFTSYLTLENFITMLTLKIRIIVVSAILGH
jgi:hypothetical protein